MMIFTGIFPRNKKSFHFLKILYSANFFSLYLSSSLILCSSYHDDKYLFDEYILDYIIYSSKIEIQDKKNLKKIQKSLDERKKKLAMFCTFMWFIDFPFIVNIFSCLNVRMCVCDWFVFACHDCIYHIHDQMNLNFILWNFFFFFLISTRLFLTSFYEIEMSCWGRGIYVVRKKNIKNQLYLIWLQTHTHTHRINSWMEKKIGKKTQLGNKTKNTSTSILMISRMMMTIFLPCLFVCFTKFCILFAGHYCFILFFFFTKNKGQKLIEKFSESSNLRLKWK